MLRMYTPLKKELPKARGNMTEAIKIPVVSCIFAIGCFPGGAEESCLRNVLSMCCRVACCVEVLAAAEVMGRLLSVAEERRHLVSRYRSSYVHLLSSLFVFPRRAFFLFSATVCSHWLISRLGYDGESSFSKLLLCSIFIGKVLLDLVNINRNPVSDSVFLDSLRGLDYGSGMAQSYFYGYLRLCLPDTGDQEKGLVERIEDYMSEQKLPPASFPVKRLFVLIPSSSYIPANFRHASYGWMQEQGSLMKQVRTRAGVIGRVYKNSVYRIKDPHDDDDEAIYVVAEGATPCKTLHEVIQNSGIRKDLYMKHQNEIISNFHSTLVETLKEHEDCSRLCEVIYYIDRDENEREINVAHVIKQRILEITENEQSMREQQQRQWQGMRLSPEGRV